MNKKYALFYVVLTMVTSVALGQDKLHFMYIQQDNSVSTSKLITEINCCMSQYQKEKYVVYYSDVKPMVMDQTNYNWSYLENAISTQNSTVSISTLKELNSVSEILERYNYSEIDLHCFVGSEFFENGYQNSLIARLLIVNELNKPHTTKLTYHICGTYQSGMDTAFNEKFNINVTYQTK